MGEEGIKYGDLDNLTGRLKVELGIILRDYGSMEPYDIRELSCNGKPWKKARRSLPEGAKWHNVITKRSMRTYYGSL